MSLTLGTSLGPYQVTATIDERWSLESWHGPALSWLWPCCLQWRRRVTPRRRARGGRRGWLPVAAAHAHLAFGLATTSTAGARPS